MCHVLIIEDEFLVALALETVLADHGATSFDIADTEEAAVAAARAHPPAFIVSDVALREGTGPGAVRAIHAMFGRVPVIFVTASPSACRPCEPPGRVFEKPMNEAAIAHAFHEMTS